MKLIAIYNANNQLTQWGTVIPTYDKNGNTLSDGMNTYSWDARNRLRSANNNGAVFSYDPLGRRVSKTIQTTTTNFLYDGVNAVQEYGANPTANLLTGGVDERFTRTTSAETDEYLTDALGSTVELTNATGATEEQYSYSPYGVHSATGATTTNSYTYTGREFDGLGIDYYRARYYNPNTGRFLSEDPMGFLGSGPNLYRYAADSPTNLIDPSGLANLNLFNPQTDLELWELANGWQPSGYYSVAGHGVVYSDGTPANLIDGTNGTFYTPQQLAQYIMNDPNWKHQTIDLRSCSAGKGANSFAQQLANALNVPVIAPTDTLFWGPSFFQLQNTFQTTNWLSSGSGDVTIPNGSWQTFSPVVR